MNKYVNAEKIVEEMERDETMCLTSVERTLLHIAVLKGAMAMVDYEHNEWKERKKLLAQPKKKWYQKLFNRNKIVIQFKNGRTLREI